MELTDICESVKRIFGITDIKELSNALYDTVIHNNYDKYAEFQTAVGDLTTDTLQEVFQFYEADRKEKKQDYTPLTLARLTGKITEADNEHTVLDLCAGSGALTIQKWNLNKSLNFVCYELDTKVIPLLLFNLAVRNITATVINGDALQDEVFATYEVASGERFASVTKTDGASVTTANSCISNPPYNIKWEYPVFAELQTRFANCELPPENNANYAFILTALDKINGKCAMILPISVLSTTNAKEARIRQYLVEQNFIDAVILCPDKMFEATNIATCILVLNKNKLTNNIELVDMRQTYEVEKREQRGQYGGKSHTNRMYHKGVKVFTDAQIEKALDSINNRLNVPEFSKAVPNSEIAKNKFIITPTRHIESNERETTHRDYSDIARDLNYIAREKAVLKITMNEKLAKTLGFDVDLYKDDEKNAEALNDSLSAVGQKYEYRPYIAFSKNKNEFKIENQDKELFSSVLRMFLPMWKQHLYYLNNLENNLLSELRNAMIPDLMSGKIEITNVKDGGTNDSN